MCFFAPVGDMEKVSTTLELDDELDLHQKGWIVQRIGWICMMLLIAAASLGAFGSGWLSQESYSKQSQSVCYEKFARLESPMILQFNCTAINGTTTIRVPQSYMQGFEIKQITPTPSGQKAVDGSIEYTFDSVDRITVRFHLEPQVVGSRIARVKVNEVDFGLRHFIYP